MFDDDLLTHAAARGDERAQLDLARFYLGKADEAENVIQGISWSLGAGIFAMLAAAQGLTPAVRIYAQALRCRIRWGNLAENTIADLTALAANLEAAVIGKTDDERVEVRL